MSISFALTSCAIAISFPKIYTGQIAIDRIAVLWTLSLGGLGVCAFFGTSLLSQLGSDVADDPSKWKERITDPNYLQTRLMVGILFAFVLGLPFGRYSLSFIANSISAPPTGELLPTSAIPKILAPFLFGFSTSLVLIMLERLIDTLKTLVGVQKG